MPAKWIDFPSNDVDWPPYDGPELNYDLHYTHDSKDGCKVWELEHIAELKEDCIVPYSPEHIQLRLRQLTDRKGGRNIMAAVAYSHDGSMASHGGAPGSPPDLTNSKSSKSSSFHSSTLSDVMGPSDLSHFEDINLADAGPSSFPMPASSSERVLFDGPRHSAIHRSMSTPLAPVHTFRDLTGGRKPQYPSLQPQIKGMVRQSSTLIAPNRSMKRGFTSPSAPSLANLAAPGRRSRSPSPNTSQTMPPAPRSISRRSSRNLDISPIHGTNSRRQSWQHPVRKTVKEREAECDDEDDEVPEDMNMWNVPISPRAIPDRSPAPSTCNSPPQASPSPASSRPTSQRDDQPFFKSPKLHQKQVPHIPLPPSPNFANKENTPPMAPLTRQRSSTWEDTYLALDEDAKKVTEALEELQSSLEREQELKRQQPGGLSRSSSVEQKPETKKPALPPIRKSDPLIDPFQPSVEKSKHLSRTRPSWLPPKDPKEEKKHLKEYAKMQARIQEAMKEQARKEETEALARETVSAKKAELWENLLLPKYTTEVATTVGKTTYRQMWWTGIPPKMRGAVWKTAIGNDLEISQTTFNVALQKARAEIQELGDRALGGRIGAIIHNTAAVFPELKIFGGGKGYGGEGEEQPFHRDLVDVCLAYSAYRPDVDTLKGIHHIAGLFLLNMSAPDTFITLGNLLNRPLPLSFLIKDHTAMTAAYDITLSTLSQKAPQLARRLEELRVEPRDYLEPAFSSLFCDRLSIEHAARLMDVYAIEGDKIATRAAVGLMGIKEGKLYQGSTREVLSHLNSGDMKMHPDDFMAKVYEAGKSS